VLTLALPWNKCYKIPEKLEELIINLTPSRITLRDRYSQNNINLFDLEHYHLRPRNQVLVNSSYYIAFIMLFFDLLLASIEGDWTKMQKRIERKLTCPVRQFWNVNEDWYSKTQLKKIQYFRGNLFQETSQKWLFCGKTYSNL
jgi:hypothetical protein